MFWQGFLCYDHKIVWSYDPMIMITILTTFANIVVQPETINWTNFCWYIRLSGTDGFDFRSLIWISILGLNLI